MKSSSVRLFFISSSSLLIGLAMAFVAQGLLRLIDLFTNLCFYGRPSFHNAGPAGNALGAWVLIVPVVGAMVVGIMARYGAPAIRGHGIPEAMEQVLLNQSRIPPRVFLLKPISSAIAIGSGGPFGAEGPIIATGGSLGSLIGQWFHTSPLERKILLAAGAAAGMAATFGCPISAVILATELLLFEFHPRSVVPVSLASAAAAGMRQLLVGGHAVFHMADVSLPTPEALIGYFVLGAIIGVASVGITRALYLVEDAFDHLPVHWMWWPAIGAVAVGIVGYFEPRTLGVGYENISDMLSGTLAPPGPARLCLLKFISWTISLASGTSGGTLAPLMTMGAGAGTIISKLILFLFPGTQMDTRMAALVGMAATFAGASGALLASVVFAIETTFQVNAIVPVLGGCTAAYFISRIMMVNTIMTEKIARRGVDVPTGYTANIFDRVRVSEVASKPPICIKAEDAISSVRTWLQSGSPESRHKGFPVVRKDGTLVGFLSRRTLLDTGKNHGQKVESLISRPPVTISNTANLREATFAMLKARVGVVPVVSHANPHKLLGVLARRDILGVYHHDEEFSELSG